MKSTFILVHGGFHASWCWDRLVPLLSAAGHVVLTPDLQGMGADATPHDRVTLASSAGAIVDLVCAQQHPVVLVGHSMGGMVIGEVAERIPENILGLVFVTAVLMLKPGPEPQHSSAKLGPKMNPSADGHSVICDPDTGRERFFNTTEPGIADAAVARLEPQPLGVMTGAITATADRFGRVPRAFVECTHDQSIPIAHQRAMQTALPCDPVFTLDTDHSPFLCAPEELAKVILAAADQFRAMPAHRSNAIDPGLSVQR